MLELSRTVRFCLSPDPADDKSPRDNTFASWPAMRGLGRYYELHVVCHGEAEPRTGYFINIKHIDTAVRDHALPPLRAAIADEQAALDLPMGALMRDLFTALAPALDGSVHRLALQLTPTLALSIEKPAMDTILTKQQYEFSAAHRLHVPEHSDKENRQTFGKCNNPAGHGHNYRVEVVVRSAIDPRGRVLSPAALDAAVDQHVIEKLDHKHLNVDVPEFADLNPSVEHIVRVVWDMLSPNIPIALPNAQLDEVSVWETGKTACTYRGPAAVTN
ncbi:MAG: 6-carboxytetrahydropterin synthase [Planctomycetota bacterium]